MSALQASAQPAAPSFMQFPIIEQIVGAEKADAVLWTVRQGADTSIQFGAAPHFAPVTLFTKSDDDGQPIAGLALSPAGHLAVFQTAVPYAGEVSYNPAALLERPRPMLWSIATQSGAILRQIGPGAGAAFSPGGRLLYRHEGDLYVGSFDAQGVLQSPVVVKGGARFQNLAWTSDDSSFVFIEERGGYSFLGRYRLNADRVEWLVSGPDRLSSPAVSPDGRHVAYVRFAGREHSRSYDQTAAEPFAIESVDLASHVVRVWWQTKSPAGIAADGLLLRWVGNDRVLFSSEEDGWARLYEMGSDGGAPKGLSPPECEVAEGALLLPETLAMVHNCRDLDTRQLTLVNLRTGRERPIPLADRVIARATRVGEGYLAFAGSGADSSPLLRVWDLRVGKLAFVQQTSNFGWRAAFSALDPVTVRFTARDGSEVHAQLFLPATRGRHPALIYVHGGPQRQMFPAFHFMRYYANDYAVNRQFAARGYVVLSINYRSGTGYGRNFRDARGRAWRGASEYADVVAGARYLAGRSDVEPGRLGIWGGSYGGLLTAQALARDSALFKAGVAVHGVFDWSWPTPRPQHLNPSAYFGVGPDERPGALASSPLGAIEGWRSPVLLFSGDEDANVDVNETVDLTQKLRARGVEVHTTIVPGEAHDFVRHSTWQLLWQQACEFFDSKLGGGAVEAPCT